MAGRIKRALPIIGALLLAVAAYSNHFRNSFHFDDAHTIENNAAIREIGNIPRFFRDATLFSSLPSNQSYRPIVSTLFTIDYRLGATAKPDIVNPFWFHASIFALFVGSTLLLGFIIRKFLDSTNSLGDRSIGIFCAALFALHPANADTVNYIIASAEIIAALGIVASFAIYFACPKWRRFYVFVLPAAIAVLAKPPAAIFAVLFAIYRLMFPENFSKGPRSKIIADIVAPFLVCAAALILVQAMTPKSWIGGARSHHDYLITQPYVALRYFKTFFLPNDLSADYDLNPFTTTNEPRFWAGLVFVVTLAALIFAAFRFKQTRVIAFGLLWFLIALLPTSLFPLAEVMNDHRTFISYVGLMIAIAGAISWRGSGLGEFSIQIKTVITFAAIFLLCLSAYASFQRNKVWRTEETLWRDVTIKSPGNPRGLMNYGNALMARGDYDGALEYFHRALALAPQYSVLLVNLGVAESATKQDKLAETHFKEALRLAGSSPDSYIYYARFLLAHGRVGEARPLIRRALELSPSDIIARNLVAEMPVDERSPESLLERSLELYLAQQYADSIAAAESALKLRPDYAEAWNNICAANNKLGKYQEAETACEQALRCKPNFDLARNNLQYAHEMRIRFGR